MEHHSRGLAWRQGEAEAAMTLNPQRVRTVASEEADPRPVWAGTRSPTHALLALALAFGLGIVLTLLFIR